MRDLDSIFSEHGVLARAVPNFRMRQSQLEMARAIAGALEDNSALIAEARNPTAETFAYLARALLTGGKCTKSTATTARQLRQIVHTRPAHRHPASPAVTG